MMSLFIDLDKIEENVKTITKITLKPLMAVVKSNAYGLGSNQIVKKLIESKVEWFVYNKEKELLKDKILLKDKKVLLLTPVTKTFFTKYHQENFRYTINSLKDIMIIINTKKLTYVHIQVDTGLNRLGINDMFTFKKVIQLLLINPLIVIEGLFTHYIGDNDEEFAKQTNLLIIYNKEYEFKVIHAGSTRVLHKKLYGNMIRVGMGLYGYVSKLPLKPCVKYYTHIVNSFYLNTNEQCGYAPSYKTQELIKVGVIPIGYDDCQNLSYVTYRRNKIDLLGNSCMNHSHIKLNELINNQSCLSVFEKNDIIDENDKDYINWYKRLISIKTVPKNYLKRINYDLPKIFKQTNEKSYRIIKRERSN